MLIAAYFFYLFHRAVGFPPERTLEVSSTTYLIVSVFFFLLPAAKKLKLGRLFEYEAHVKELREQVREFKDDTRQMLALQASIINTVSSTLNQNININLPGKEELDEAEQELEEAIGTPSDQDLDKRIETFLLEQNLDRNFALAKLRMELEKELRRILHKRIDTEDPSQMKGRFLSARSLFNEFSQVLPQYSGMRSSFNYILQVCNAAIHGQRISDNHADEALHMGFKMLDALRRIGENEL